MTHVSVGLPVYNGERYLEEALGDLARQTHQDLDVVISDNGSTDRTAEICQDYAAADPRVRFVRQPMNRGAGWNHDEVARLARGPYFRWYAYDDRLNPRCVEACAAVLDEHPETVLAWPLTSVIDDDGHPSGDYRDDLPWDDTDALTRMRSLLGPRHDESLLHMCYPVYGVIRLDVLRQTHMMAPYAGSDTALLIELALRGSWRPVPERLFVNRRHAASSAWGKPPEQLSAYLDPSRGDLFPMPQVQLLRGYLRAVATTPLEPSVRARAYAVVARWAMAESRPRVLVGEGRIRLRQELARIRT